MGSTFLMNAKGHSYIAVTYLKSANPRSYMVTIAHKGHFDTIVDLKIKRYDQTLKMKLNVQKIG